MAYGAGCMMPAVENNYFSILDIEESVDIEPEVLNQAYFSQQRKYHPDKVASPDQRSVYLQHSADINTAYHTLKDTASRLYYLSSKHGYDILADASSVKTPAALLMESMEWQESLESCHNSETLKKLTEQCLADIARTTEQAKMYMRAKDWKQAVEPLLRLRYLNRMNEQLSHHRVSAL